ncbi:MAG: hypothetical protein ACE5SW_12055 [Nitrososphaeraceae archaeon]
MSCNKEFNNLVDGVKYSSSVMGTLSFCSDTCCNAYLTKKLQ